MTGKEVVKVKTLHDGEKRCPYCDQPMELVPRTEGTYICPNKCRGPVVISRKDFWADIASA
jgi:hypothetical protein